MFSRVCNTPHLAGPLITKVTSLIVQRRAARFVMNGYSRTSRVTDMLIGLSWDTLEHRCSSNIVNYQISDKHHSWVRTHHCEILETSRDCHRYQIRARTTSYKNSFFLEPSYCGATYPTPPLTIYHTRMLPIRDGQPSIPLNTLYVLSSFYANIYVYATFTILYASNLQQNDCRQARMQELL